MTTVEQKREAIRELLRKKGPMCAADIIREVPITKGSFYHAARHESLTQLPNADWTEASPPTPRPVDPAEQARVFERLSIGCRIEERWAEMENLTTDQLRRIVAVLDEKAKEKE